MKLVEMEGHIAALNIRSYLNFHLTFYSMPENSQKSDEKFYKKASGM